MTFLCRRGPVAALVFSLALVSCGDDSSSSVTLPPLESTTTTTTTTTASSTTIATTTTATTAPTTTRAPASTVAAGDCSASASHTLSGGFVVTPPRNASLKCEAGWRMFGWIGESGDGILLIQRANGSTWTTNYYGPGCGGVASAPVNDLVSHGLPRPLAEKWGGGCG